VAYRASHESRFRDASWFQGHGWMLGGLRNASWRAFEFSVRPATAAVLLIAMSCGAALVGIYGRGPWYDEFATRYFADPSVPLSRAWLEIWPSETNPPFYYLVARLAAGAFGRSIPAGRLLNAVPLAFLMFWLGFAWRRRPERRGFLIAYASLVFGGTSFLVMLPSYRSYFWQYCAAVVFIGAAAIGSKDRGRTPGAFQFAATPFLLLLHQVTAIYAFILMCLLTVDDCRRRLLTRVASQFAIAAVSLIPLIVFTTMQSRRLDSVLIGVAWIPPQAPLAAIWELLGYLARALGQNWVAITAAAGAVLVGRRIDADRRRFAIMLAVALLAATAVTLAINTIHPIIVERYFMFLYAGAACLVSTLIEPEMAARRWLVRGVLLNAFIFVSAFGTWHATEPLWEEGARKVAAVVEKCASTKVHGGSLPLDAIEQSGLSYLAARHRFSVLPPTADTPGDCPVVYWVQFRSPRSAEIAQLCGDVARAANFTAHLDLPETALVDALPTVVDSGVILVVAPVPSARQ
jgi:hypothetical protein